MVKANKVQHNAHVLAKAAQPASASASVKGAATAARWFKASLKANPYAGLTPAQAKAKLLALPASTVITCQVNHNPKGGASNPIFALYFGAQPVAGATTTLGAVLQAGANFKSPQTPASMAGHLVWDLARNFIAL